MQLKPLHYETSYYHSIYPIKHYMSWSEEKDVGKIISS
ncbi:hypothetical protein JCM19298_1619 [Nonlabens ulvanivorans]|nr:hypothetical protein JCM19298_1619 [Nonlabens ulvanivorans]